MPSYLGGIAARSPTYMKAHWDHAKGFLDLAGLDAARALEEQEHLALQRQAGLDLVAPALVAWEDLLRPLTWKTGSFEAGALTRTFETNTFHRQPIHAGKLPTPDAAAWLRGQAATAAPGWVMSLPSPWDVAVRSRAAGQTSGTGIAPTATREALRERTLHVAEALRGVVAHAINQGAALVRFHDPSILYPRATARDVDTFVAGLKLAAGTHAGASTLHLTNGDPFAHAEVLLANPLGGLSIEDPGHGKVALPNRTKLSAAVLHGEESLVESPEALATAASALASRTGVPLWGITNGWDLDHVPHAIAVQKVQALAQAARLCLAEVTA